jgi:hypothetical protein
MIKLILNICIIILFSNTISAKGYDVISFGLYDIEKWELAGEQSDEAYDYRYERRFDYSLFEIGPEAEDFFNLKPFVGIEVTSDEAYYLLGGIYLDDNLGTIFFGDKSSFILTPSFGAGYYDEGKGKKLGHEIEFRTAIEISYEFINKNRIGLSLSHTSNANLGDKNPGVEVLSVSYQFPVK